MSDSPDIVARLRAVLHNDRSVELMNRKAADEIERLTRERDEARRNFCCQALPSDYKEWKPAEVDAMLKAIADDCGWDCFKEAP